MKLKRRIFIITLFFSFLIFLSAENTQKAVTLSVMKFKAISNQNIDFIGESFTDALTTKLTNIKSLRIYERSQFSKITSELQMNVDSSALFDEKTVQNIGNIVAIDYMTLGSVTLIGNKLKVTLRLVDVKTSRSLLSKEVEGTYPDDVFDLQDKLAILVVKALNIKMSTLEKEQVLKDPTNNMDAYDYYNKSLAGASKRERINLLKKALSKDPDFVLARHCLAETYIDNNDYNDSIQEYQHLLENNPSDFKAHYNLGLLWFDLGKYDKSEKELQRASVLQKDNPDVWYNLALLKEFDKNGNRLGHDVDRTEIKKAYEKVLEINSRHLESHYALGVLNAMMASESTDINVQKQCLEEAIAHLETYLSIYPDVFNASEVKQNINLLKGSLQQIKKYMEN